MVHRVARSGISGWMWIGVALLSIILGVRYLATEPLIFEPGGWFALDGRRVLEVGTAWRAGGDPYAVPGFVYSPVAVVIAAALSSIPAVAVLLTWLAGSMVGAALAVWREARESSAAIRGFASAGVLLFIPTIADLVLVNVTIALVVAVWVAIRGARFRSGVALGLLGAAFPKPFLVPIVIWLLIWRRNAGFGVVVSAGAASLIGTAIVGPSSWADFANALRSIGSSDLDFIGNYGMSKLAPDLVPIIVVLSVMIFLVVLSRRDPESSLVAATAVGVLVAPYSGIYAALPMLLAIRPVLRWSQAAALALCMVGILTAPWAVAVAVPLLAYALARAVGKPIASSSSPQT